MLYEVITFSLSYRERNNKGFKSLKAENCHFYYVNRNDNDSIFSLTEFDHCDGFHVHMENIKVIPLDMTAIDAPSWLFKLIKPFCKKMV